jgi:hypothetical protein
MLLALIQTAKDLDKDEVATSDEENYHGTLVVAP